MVMGKWGLNSSPVTVAAVGTYVLGKARVATVVGDAGALRIVTEVW